MKIPVFVSCPTSLNEEQDRHRTRILDQLEALRLEPRALGRSDYPSELPLREVYVIAKHCSGGVILGFSQLRVDRGEIKAGTDKAKPIRPSNPVHVPTAWNHLEAGILFGMNLPLLIFREPGVSGGVFDNGVTDVFIHQLKETTPEDDDALGEIFLKWRARVSEHYYS
jgi:hypothetical protein